MTGIRKSGYCWPKPTTAHLLLMLGVSQEARRCKSIAGKPANGPESSMNHQHRTEARTLPRGGRDSMKCPAEMRLSLWVLRVCYYLSALSQPPSFSRGRSSTLWGAVSLSASRSCVLRGSLFPCH